MSDEIPIFILDSYAVLAYLNNEPGGKQVQRLLEQSEKGQCKAMLSLINLGEVLYITERQAGLHMAQTVLSAIEQLPLEILPASQEAVFLAAHIKANYRLSYADAFSAAAAQAMHGILITGDPEFHTIESELQIQWI